MSDNENTGGSTGEAPDAIMGMDELTVLKNRAKMLGITFSNNIKLDALKLKIENKMNDIPDEPEKTDSLDDGSAGQFVANALDFGAAKTDNVPVPERKLTLREYLHNDAMRLIRLRITNLDPKKKDLPGEVLTVANEYIGTVRKFIPYGEHTEDGYHVPFVLYEMLKNRKFLNIRTVRDRRTGANSVQKSWAPEFALEILEPLTKDEIQQLATAQMSAGSVDLNAA